MTSSEQLMAPETAAMTVTTKLLAQELTKDLQVNSRRKFEKWDIAITTSEPNINTMLIAIGICNISCFPNDVVPEDHINDSDQSSTLAGCSACCDHATTSENTEDQICISIHVAPFHSSVVPEDHLNDSDQSSTIAGCSTCCDHAMTSENTEDQRFQSIANNMRLVDLKLRMVWFDTFGLHTRIFHVLQLSITHLQRRKGSEENL
uniref:Uncharacterized protein n=1 Tax=Oryza rufipogon TaxID=4529 RepID=A0A0E0P5C3_ORYRU